MQKQKTFKQAHTLEQRIKMYQKGKAQKHDCIVVIVQKQSKCQHLPSLKHCKFSIQQKQKIIQIQNAIRSRVVKIDEKYAKQPIFLFVGQKMPNKQQSIKDIYTTYQDPQDHLLYIKYSNFDPYGFS